MWNRHFLLLWQGLLVSQLGTQLFSLALLYWILETTGSATIMGLVLMAAALPGVFLGPFAGTLADNVSRKALLISADVVARCGRHQLRCSLVVREFKLGVTGTVCITGGIWRL